MIIVILLCVLSLQLIDAELSVTTASGNSFKYWPGFYNHFLKDGPIVNMRYRIAPRRVNRYLMDYDFRGKLWCAMQNLPRLENDHLYTQRLRLTIVRLDNMMDHLFENMDVEHRKHDKYWRESTGWPQELTLIISSPIQQMVIVPASKHGDILQMDIQVTSPEIPLPTVRNYDRDIPTNIFQVTTNKKGQYVPLLHKCSTLTKIMNPNWIYRGISLDQVKPILSTIDESPSSVLDALNTLRPIAFQIDLFRLVILYHYGGVYSDTRLVPIVSYEEFLPKSGGLMPLDADQHGFYNAFLALPKHSSLAQAGINQILMNIQNRYYGNHVLAPTGPHSLARAFNSLLSPQEQSKYSISIELDKKEARFIKDRVTGDSLIVSHNGEYRRAFTYRDPNHYSILYETHQIYTDDIPVIVKIKSESDQDTQQTTATKSSV